MGKLTTHKFCELYEMSSGISSKPEQAGHGKPFLSFSTVFNNYFIPDTLPDLMNTSKEEQKKHSVLKGDIFLTRTSEVIEELAMSSVALKDYQHATFSGFLKRLRPLQDNVTYHKFMAFYLRSELFRKTMTNNAVLTLRASLNENIFSYLDLILPDFNDQVKIGDLLHLIYSKIELNLRINAELEAMAKTLYDYWFVQFDFPNNNGKTYKSSGGKMVWDDELKREIPKGWEVGSLLDIAEYANGLPCQKYRPTGPDSLRVIKIKEMHQGFNKDTELVKTDIPQKAIVENGDVLFAWSASLEVQIWAGGKGALNQHIFKVTSDKYPRSFYYYQLINYLQHFKMMAENRKTTMGHITQDHLKQSRIVLPPRELADKLDTKLKPILTAITNNLIANRTLAELRDWLLPMLMNGQVKVK
jgi:type I restriction enzyme, S subunit